MQLTMSSGKRYFLKWVSGNERALIVAEAGGLAALAAAESPLRIPRTVALEAGTDDASKNAFLLLEWVQKRHPGKGFWRAFGSGLARLHQVSSNRFGFDSNNFIGRLPQENAWQTGWITFFREQRLAPQLDRARHGTCWQVAWDVAADRLMARLDDLLPDQPVASLLHGDLWNGNYIVSGSDTATLIDPAVYFGHRETDLAMTELFGGFDSTFYAAYREVWDLESGYEQRKEIYNLYHLLNHLNHFGASYAPSVRDVLRRWS